MASKITSTYHAVATELVSANRLPEYGHFWEMVRDFRQVLAKVADFRTIETNDIGKDTQIKRAFARKWATLLGRVTAWLPRRGANSHIPISNSPFEMSRDLADLGIGDLCAKLYYSGACNTLPTGNPGQATSLIPHRQC